MLWISFYFVLFASGASSPHDICYPARALVCFQCLCVVVACCRACVSKLCGGIDAATRNLWTNKYLSIQSVAKGSTIKLVWEHSYAMMVLLKQHIMHGSSHSIARKSQQVQAACDCFCQGSYRNHDIVAVWIIAPFPDVWSDMIFVSDENVLFVFILCRQLGNTLREDNNSIPTDDVNTIDNRASIGNVAMQVAGWHKAWLAG